MNVNLTPNITGKNVNIIKGATQADLTNSVNNSKTYRDEAEAFSIVSEAKSVEAYYSALNASISSTTASDKATIATTKANDASNSANSASASEAVCIAKATIATDNANIAIAQAVIATNKATEANTSANTANTQANIAITKASEASISAINALTSENNADTSEANALIYRNQAESFANSINHSDLVHISGTETITGNKTFSGTVSGLTKATVGLSNVDNTSDANKPISTDAQTALDMKANLSSPALTGTPTAPTAVVGTNTTQLATTAYVKSEVANETYTKAQVDSKLDAQLVGSIAELKLMDGSTVNKLEVLGYYAKGDGGGGTFYWDSTSIESDNSGTIIQATGVTTGRWKRVFRGAVNVKWFGIFSDTGENVYTTLQYIHDNFDMELNDGTYITNEIVINSYKKIIGSGESRTVLKWDNSSSGINKSVIRASRSSVGINPTNAISFSNISNFSIDATGCDYGLYAVYCTNETSFENITAFGASKSNISILKSWFAKYINLTGKNGVDKGISIATALSGESGDLAVNACYFENIRAHANGTGNTYNISTNPSGGAGICVGTIFRGSLGSTIQSEQNGGAGLYTKTSYPIAIGFLYLESNCTSDSLNNRSLYIETTGSYSDVTIDAVYLADNAKIYTTSQLSIKFLSRNDNIDTFVNTGMKAVIQNSNLGVFSNTNFGNISSLPINVAFFPNINLRYSTSLNNTFFYTDETIIPYVILIPRATVTMTNPIFLKIDANASANYGATFTQGVPAKVRHTNITTGVHVLSTSGSAQSIDNYCDIIVIHYKILPNFNRL